MTLRDDVMLASDRVQVEHFARQPDDRWILAVHGPGASFTLTGAPVMLSVDDLYERAFDPLATQ